MTFIHLEDITPIEMEAKTDEDSGKRVYLTPGGEKYASVTTVIGSNPAKMKGIMKWRKRVGEDKANAISKRSTSRGTKYHSIVEDYINNVLELDDYKKFPLPVVMFHHSRASLDRINKIYLQEAALYSDTLKLAGRVDCIAEFDGELSIIDFKTSGEFAKKPSLDLLMKLVTQDLDKVNATILEHMQSPVHLIPQLAGHLIAAGGKRLRPMLTLGTAALCQYSGDRHIKLAACVEFIHTATLLHDDVVDASELRRGKLTANSVWGNQPSVLVGDFLFSRAFQLMVSDGSLHVLKLLSNASAAVSYTHLRAHET